MQTTDSQQVIRRFFEALQRLKADKKIRGKYLINPKYGIKGRITEDTYTELVLRRFPKGRILPNKDFEPKGGAQ